MTSSDVIAHANAAIKQAQRDAALSADRAMAALLDEAIKNGTAQRLRQAPVATTLAGLKPGLRLTSRQSGSMR